jgi:hypothetical protein
MLFTLGLARLTCETPFRLAAASQVNRCWKNVKHLGLDNTRQISRVLVDPKNPDVALSQCMAISGPNPERGVYRTKDGATWQKVLYKNEDVG